MDTDQKRVCEASERQFLSGASVCILRLRQLSKPLLTCFLESFEKYGPLDHI